jgi:LacI family transcriptional regulator
MRFRFRSYFRERASDLQVLDAITTFEDSKYAYQGTLDLLHHAPDLVGLFIAGGGKSGVLRGLREDATGLAKTLNVVGLDLTPEARSGLLDGVIDVILAHPIKLLEETTVDLLASVKRRESRTVSPFNGCCRSKSIRRRTCNGSLVSPRG